MYLIRKPRKVYTPYKCLEDACTCPMHKLFDSSIENVLGSVELDVNTYGGKERNLHCHWSRRWWWNRCDSKQTSWWTRLLPAVFFHWQWYQPGQLLLESSARRFELSRSPEVMKMELMRLLQASLLARTLACLLRLMMVLGQLLGSTTRRLEVSRCIGRTSREQSKILRLHQKIQLLLFEHWLKITASNSRVPDSILFGLLGSDKISILCQDFHRWINGHARACHCLEQHGESENEWLTSP